MTSFGQPSHTGQVRRSSAFATPPRARTRDRWEVPALVARPGGAAERFARSLGHRHPAAVFFAAVLLGLIAMAALSVALGWIVLHVLVGSLGLGGTDNSVNVDLARERTGTLTDLSAIGSAVGGAPVLPILVGLIGIACAVTKHWRLAAFVVFVLVIESATYRITTLFIHRDRPGVHRLENLPVDASFPSGHTAASVAVYSGLVYLIASRLTSSATRAVLWTLAVVLTTFVALSRMYRGMHHPLDVAGGIVVGICAIAVMLFACRAAGVAAEAWKGARQRA